jgi:hypothetical protein
VLGAESRPCESSALSTQHSALLHLCRQLVDVAPKPPLARLERANDRMFRPVIVLRRMLVFGRIAAADVATFEAEAQMNPGVTAGEALLASIGSVGFAMKLLRCDGAEMLTEVHGCIVTTKVSPITGS